MVTITAPGVEIKEIDLSYYDLPKDEEETQNVLITGFSPKGITRVPVKFTNKNTVDDLLDTFGTPTNEAERYFFNACSEAIKRDKVVLYAIRLPYDNDQDNSFSTVTYTLTADTYKKLSELSSDSTFGVAATAIISADNSLSDKYMVCIDSSISKPLDLDTIEKYRAGSLKPDDNTFTIVEKNQTIYEKIPADSQHMTDDSRRVIGVLPVVTTATNAMYYKKLIDCEVSSISYFEPTNALKAVNDVDASLLAIPMANDTTKAANGEEEQTISKYAASFFPSINIQEDGTFARDRLTNIGVVVFKGYVDSEYNGKVMYEPVEAFAGSLKQDEVDQTTGESRFIDDIINTNSELIEFYSNCFNTDLKTSFSTSTKTTTAEGKTKTLFSTAVKNIPYSNIGILNINKQKSYALGFNELSEDDKLITPNMILKSLDKAFAKINNVNSEQIDLVVDAGVANIADFMCQVNDNKGSSEYVIKCYNPTAYVISNNAKYSAVEKWDVCDSRQDGVTTSVSKSYAIKQWQAVLKKYDEFCKKRGDCMFLADGLRPLCIQGNRKRVRGNNYKTTVDNAILPFMKYIAGKVNTSYGAGYCDWYQIVDPTSQVNIWMPPSVAAMQTYLDVANSKYFWSTPAGVNNGKMKYAKDIAFNPTVEQAGGIYDKSWNYCSYYHSDGFVLEGNKTFQLAKTAFDRVNVRRLFLYLERKTFNAAKYFIYEGNTAYTRQKLVDAIKPYFDDAKVNGGLYDYRIICDESNNTNETIDANELHVKIAIKPTKAIEFIECTFIALKTGGSFTEAGITE